MKNFLLVIPLIFLLAACQQEDRTPLLIGKWKGISWTVQGKDSGRNAANVRFEFKNDKTYTASYGGDNEAGTFRLRFDSKLFTIEDGKIEKSVLLSKITADTLIMDMNRVGDSEQLVLVKVK